MHSRRQFLNAVWIASAGAVCLFAPVRVEVGSDGIDLVDVSAEARDENGGGNGRGGRSSGDDRGGGDGKGNGNWKGNGNGRLSGTGRDSAGNSRTANPDNDEIDVKHPDGMTEEIRSGRYIMRDARGRLIIDRRATASDQQRLDSFR